MKIFVGLYVREMYKISEDPTGMVREFFTDDTLSREICKEIIRRLCGVESDYDIRNG